MNWTQTLGSIPPWLLVPAAIGAGGLGLAGLTGTQRQWDNVLRKLERTTEGIREPEETGVGQYADTMAHATQLSGLAHGAENALVGIRKHPILAKLFGSDAGGHKITTPAEEAAARGHYRAFERGPIAAYTHMLDTSGHEIPLYGDAARITGENTYGGALAKMLDEFWKSAPGHSNKFTVRDVTPEYMSMADQTEFLNAFRRSVQPAELRPVINAVENGELFDRWQPELQKYQAGLVNAEKMRRGAQTVGATGAGVAAGGALGHILHDAFRDEDPEGNEKRDRAYWASTLGGAGLGGTAAFLAGTRPGHELITKLFKSGSTNAALSLAVIAPIDKAKHRL